MISPHLENIEQELKKVYLQDLTTATCITVIQLLREAVSLIDEADNCCGCIGVESDIFF